MGNLKQTGINMLSGGAGYFLPMMINFIATPVVLSKLGPEGYGIQSLVNVIMGYLMVADMGLDIPITKLLAEYTIKSDFTQRNKLLNNTLQIYLCIGVLGMTAIFILEPFMQSFFNIPKYLYKEARLVFIVTGIGFLGNILSMWGRAVYAGLQRYDIANGILTFFNLISTIGGVILLYNDFGIVHFVLAKVIGFYLSATSYLIIGKASLPNYTFFLGFDEHILKEIRPLIGYGFLLRISGMVFARLDQSLISAWIGIAAVGIYSIPLLITSAVSGLISGVMNYTFPKASELHATKSREKLQNLFTNSTKYVSLQASLLFGFLIVMGDKFLSLWVGEDVATTAQQPLIILSIAYFINAITAIITNNFVVAMGGMRFFTVYGVLRGIVMVTGYYFFIRPFGINGAALGILLGGVLDILYMFLSLKRFIGYPPKNLFDAAIWKPIFIGSTSGLLVHLLRPFILTWTMFILSGLLYVTIFILLTLLLRVFSQREKELLLAIIKRAKQILS